MTTTELITLEGDKPIYASQLNDNFDLLDGKITDLTNSTSQSISSLSTLASGALPKSGGTMTGNLTISKGGHPYLYLNNTAETAGTAPSANMYKGVVFQAKVQGQAKEVGQVGNTYYVSGARSSFLSSTKADGSGKAEIRVGYDASGNEFFSFPKCTTKPQIVGNTVTSSATSNLVAVIVKNYKKNASWYRVWSDGWIEQGGATTNSGTSDVNISLLRPFQDTNYTVVLSFLGNSEREDAPSAKITDVDKFTIIHNANVNSFGWYACGY